MTEFYHSISEDLFLSSLNHNKNFIDIIDEQIEIVLMLRNFIFTHNNSTSIKYRTEKLDGPIGVYDSAQIADLTGFYTLHILSRQINLSQVGLYRIYMLYDGSIFIPDRNGSKTSKIHE